MLANAQAVPGLGQRAKHWLIGAGGMTLHSNHDCDLLASGAGHPLHVPDLLTGLRMMLTYGTHTEQNPLARFVMLYAGPVGLIALKLAVVIGGVLLFVRTAQLGRAIGSQLPAVRRRRHARRDF